MEVLYESPKITIFLKQDGTTAEYFRQLKEPQNSPVEKIYTEREDEVEYLYDGNQIQRIIVRGTNELPTYLNRFGFGFTEKYLHYYFRKKLEDKRFDTVIINDSESKLELNSIFIKSDDIENLVSDLNREQRMFYDTRSILVTNFFATNYPELELDVRATNNNKSVILRNLNDRLMEQLTAADVEKIGDFYVRATNKFSRQDVVMKLMLSMQKNAQQITLQELIKIYEKNLSDNPSESVWQQYFDKFITLFDSRYVSRIDYKNIATGITKYPDIVLVDVYGYLDFYELKKSDMRLLQYDDSHKTYFWSKELSMTIAQVSDYLQKAKDNSLTYSKTIFEQTDSPAHPGLRVNIINPKAIIVAGSAKELSNEKMKNQFKYLRESLKDIEFVLYDELLERLRNLLQSIKVEA